MSLATSVISGTLDRVTGWLKRIVAGIRATMEFFEPEGVMVPERTWPPLTLMCIELLYPYLATQVLIGYSWEA